LHGAYHPLPADAFRRGAARSGVVLPAFEASAQSYGCSTEELGSDITHNIHGQMNSYYGISASCHEGTIALVTLANGRVKIGCAKPTTRSACDRLLRNISEAR
jgi:hypothetical protein